MIPLILLPAVCMLLMYVLCLFEDEDLKPPNGIHIVKYDGAMVKLAWNPIIFNDILDKNIIIKLWNEKMNVKEYILSPEEFSATIPFLSGSRNFVSFSVISSYKSGKSSDVFTFKAPKVVIQQVEHLNVIQLGNSSVLLVWNKPKQAKKFKEYSVEIYNQDKNIRTSTFHESNDDEVQYKITKLTGGINYKFSVRCVTLTGEASEPISINFMLKRNVISSKPEVPNFSYELVKTDQLLEMFEEPGTSDQITFIDECKRKALKIIWKPNSNGNNVVDFYVQYRKKGEEVFKQSHIETETTSITLTCLNFDSIYDIFITSLDGKFSTNSEVYEINLKEA